MKQEGKTTSRAWRWTKTGMVFGFVFFLIEILGIRETNSIPLIEKNVAYTVGGLVGGIVGGGLLFGLSGMIVSFFVKDES